MADGEDIVLHCHDQDLPLRLKNHARARRVSLRVDPTAGCVVLVKPKRVSKADAIAFALEKAEWIATSLADLQPPIPFEDGISVPVLGEPHIIENAPEARRGVWKEDGTLYVSGATEHLSRRVQDWFRDEARRAISTLAVDLAEKIDRRVTNVSIRDTRSRWGSCSADGRLSFSWRLIMTPPDVFHYVVAHEVAHLCELNHSKKFWQTVDQLTAHRQAATRWLKKDGAELYRYGLKR